MGALEELLRRACKKYEKDRTYSHKLAVDAAAEFAEMRGELTYRRKQYLEIDERATKMEAALEAISAWTIAYPLSVFPEPDFKRVRELLAAGGITVDSVSASNMRHVIEGVKKLVDEGLSTCEKGVEQPLKT